MVTRWVVLLAAYVAFVVYGSLVPLEFRPLPLGEAWARFQQIPFLRLGVESRADWIANGVLYVPLGCLGALVLLQRGWSRLGAATVAIVAAFGLAVAVEYAQLFFPPRTVSLNDLLAEAIGSVAGAVAAVVVWSMRARWQLVQRAGAGWLHHRGLALYAGAYLAYSLFPYDFLISGAELSEKLASGGWGWWLAANDGRPLVTLVRLGVELLLAAPLGAWLAARRPSGAMRPLASFSAGLALGLTIELTQLLLASGVTQGASVLARAAGVVIGAGLWARRAAWSPARVRATVLRVAPWGLPVYLLVLFGVNGWFSRAWVGPPQAADTLAGLRWQPFYYHYYTSEAQALLSLTSVALAYAPIGVWVWVRGSSVLAAALAAGVLSAVVEAGKLFLPGLRPDPTNLGIAAAAAGGVVWAARRWTSGAESGASTSEFRGAIGAGAAPDQPGHETEPRSPQSRGRSGARSDAGYSQTASVDARTATRARVVSYGSPSLWLLATAALIWQLVSAPPVMLASTFAVVTAAVVIAFRPAMAAVILAAALPLFDLAPWTGRALWDEFDLLLAACLAVAWARTPAPARSLPPLWKLGFTLLSASLIVSAAIGFWPGAALDANALAGYHSPYNALRIVKGLFWAALLVALWRRLDAGGHDPAALFARGMVLGLAGVVAWVLWERWAFVGFGDWAVHYRVTGPFSAMHRGGAFIECYIAVAMPFAAQTVLSARRWWAKAAAGVLVVAGSLAMMLTFSRNGYAALAVGMAAWTVLSLRTRIGQGPATAAAALAVLATVVVAAWPVLSGSYAQERLARWEHDLDVRVAHWRDALALRDGSVSETLFGTGLGRFPSLHYWRSRETQRAATLRVERPERPAQGEPPSFVRLGSGSQTYLDQIVRLGGAERADLALKLRARTPGRSLTVSLCEKWMLTSTTCVATTVVAGAQPEAWVDVEAVLDLRPLAASSHWRPVKLALHAPTSGATIDVAELSLTASDGRALVVNGDFARGFDNWWMSTDVDPPYHVHSLPVAVLLEQGWFGVLAWGLLLALASSAGAFAAWRGSPAAAVTTAALIAFGVSASLNTLIDEPRFLLLVLMLAWGCIAALEDRACVEASY